MAYASRRCSLLAFVLSMLVACGGTDGPTAPAASVASVIVSIPGGSLASLGETVVASVTVTDTNGNTISASVTWSTSDAGVASVSGGTVTAVGNGTATITATAGGQSGSAQVSVQQVAVGAAITPDDGVIKTASQLTGGAVDARGNPIAGTAGTWTSLTPAIVTVDDDGNLTPMSTGVGRIQLEVDGFTASAIVRTVWNVQQLSDLFALFEHPATLGSASIRSDNSQAHANANLAVLNQLRTYLASVLPSGAAGVQEFFFTDWREIWVEFIPWCGGFDDPTQTAWSSCGTTDVQHFMIRTPPDGDDFLKLSRFAARDFLMKSFTVEEAIWFFEGYQQWLMAGEFDSGGDLVVDQPLAVHKQDFATGDNDAILEDLDALVHMPSSEFYMNVELRTPVAVRMAQSVMLVDYLAHSFPAVLDTILAGIRTMGTAYVHNNFESDLLGGTSMTYEELEAAYEAHARALP